MIHLRDNPPAIQREQHNALALDDEQPIRFGDGDTSRRREEARVADRFDERSRARIQHDESAIIRVGDKEAAAISRRVAEAMRIEARRPIERRTRLCWAVSAAGRPLQL